MVSSLLAQKQSSCVTIFEIAYHKGDKILIATRATSYDWTLASRLAPVVDLVSSHMDLLRGSLSCCTVESAYKVLLRTIDLIEMTETML
jgi:hypothetical protein